MGDEKLYLQLLKLLRDNLGKGMFRGMTVEEMLKKHVEVLGEENDISELEHEALTWAIGVIEGGK